MSPALFNVYMNNLSVTLNQAGIAGSLGDNLNIPSFDELLRKYSLKSRIQDSCNSLVNGIVKSSAPLFSKIWA